MNLPQLLTKHSDGNLYIGSRQLKDEEILDRSGPCQIEITTFSDRRLKEAIKSKAKSFEMDAKAKGIFGVIAYEEGGGTVVQRLDGHYSGSFEFYAIPLYLTQKNGQFEFDFYSKSSQPTREQP